MRILSEIPHPYLKITVFKHQDKISLKINHQVYEIILKFRDGEIHDEKSFMEGLTNSDFIEEMEKNIHEIHKSRMSMIQKHHKRF